MSTQTKIAIYRQDGQFRRYILAGIHTDLKITLKDEVFPTEEEARYYIRCYCNRDHSGDIYKIVDIHFDAENNPLYPQPKKKEPLDRVKSMVDKLG